MGNFLNGLNQGPNWGPFDLFWGPLSGPNSGPQNLAQLGQPTKPISRPWSLAQTSQQTQHLAVGPSPMRGSRTPAAGFPLTRSHHVHDLPFPLKLAWPRQYGCLLGRLKQSRRYLDDQASSNLFPSCSSNGSSVPTGTTQGNHPMHTCCQPSQPTFENHASINQAHLHVPSGSSTLDSTTLHA